MIVKSVADIKLAIGVHANITYEHIKPALRSVENTILLPILGKTFYDAVANYPESQGGLKGDLRVLLVNHVVNIAFAQLVPKLNLAISDAGFTVTSTENIAPASRYRTDELMKSCYTDGYTALEEALAFLEANIDDTAFATWKASNERKATKALIVPNASVFIIYVHTELPYYSYTRLKNIIKSVQDIELPKELSSEYVAELITQQQSNDGISPNNLKVYSYIQAACANFTAALAMERYAVRITPQGLHLMLQHETEHAQQYDQANDKQINTAKASYLATANSYLYKAIDYMRANPADYPTFTAAKPLPDELPARNTKGSGYFYMH